jgi:broad specificity phosphatase PhoE
MGLLYLVRHAQASFLAENYDNLSALGESQSKVLGEYWAHHKLKFDRVAVGPCVRQKDTVKLIAQAYRQAGQTFPEPQEMPEFDEYQAEAVLKHTLPQLLETYPAIAKLHAAFKSSANSAEQRVTFQKLFETVIGRWVHAKTSPPGVESWQEFCARVNAGLKSFLATNQRGERLAIFASGGPIAVAMQRALSLSDETTLSVSWMSQNSSWSEFLYAPDRFTLSSFNSHPHIDDSAMLTYR